MKFVRRPFDVAAPGQKLVFLTPTEAFWVYMKVALIAGLILAMPFILYQIWAFIAPGLYSHEKRYAVPFVLVGSTFFLLGASFALLDRKSTRLNSSHVAISYAVFCLKKKKKKENRV